MLETGDLKRFRCLSMNNNIVIFDEIHAEMVLKTEQLIRNESKGVVSCSYSHTQSMRPYLT